MTYKLPMGPRVAVILPCYNEEKSIAHTVRGFKQVLPQSEIFVCDNNSNDSTAAVAQEAGAVVIFEPRKGKGFAVRRLFEVVEADIYLIADGDLTYDPGLASQMIERVFAGADMVVGKRVEQGDGVYRSGHRMGNKIFNQFLKFLFKSNLTDIFSGYRAFSKKFVKSFPIESKGFEIETEISVHCLCLGLNYSEIPGVYIARPADSFSKLNKYSDGIKILWKMLRLYVEYRPMQFFSLWSALFFVVGTVLFNRAFQDFIHVGLVPRLPSLVVSTMFYGLSAMGVVFGVVLHYLQKLRIEQKRLFYLRHP